MRKYETLLILPADAEDATVTAATDRIAQVIGRNGGQVTKVDAWGRRRLAYEIDRRSDGYYVAVECLADPTSMRELERVLTLADEVIRFKVVVREDAAAQPATVSQAQE
jgi:small subunit ribosomal protein S6